MLSKKQERVPKLYILYDVRNTSYRVGRGASEKKERIYLTYEEAERACELFWPSDVLRIMEYTVTKDTLKPRQTRIHTRRPKL